MQTEKYLDDEIVEINGDERRIVEESYDNKFGNLLKNKIISVDDYFQCRAFAVKHPIKDHANILRSLSIYHIIT